MASHHDSRCKAKANLNVGDVILFIEEDGTLIYTSLICNSLKCLPADRNWGKEDFLKNLKIEEPKKRVLALENKIQQYGVIPPEILGMNTELFQEIETLLKERTIQITKSLSRLE